jgi:hypothetical protein
MAEPELRLFGELLQTIQTDLRELKFAAEIDRKTARSNFDHLVSEVGATLGVFEAKMDHRLGEMSTRLDQLTGQFDQMRAEVTAQLGRIEALLQER